MYTIRKEFHFSASHQLMGLKEGHPCMHLHGHNYVIILEFQSPVLNKDGFVIDYRELNPFKEWMDETLDHKNLNGVLQFQPSAENIAEYIYDIWSPIFPAYLHAVEVKETPKTRARYEAKG